MFWIRKKSKPKEYELVEVDLKDTTAVIELQNGIEVRKEFKGEIFVSNCKEVPGIIVSTGYCRAKLWYQNQCDLFEISKDSFIPTKDIKSLNFLVDKTKVKVFAEKGMVQPEAKDEEW